MKYISICSGIEAITQAWHPLGFTPLAFSEIEPFPCAVLAHHYPAVPNLGDMTRFRAWPVELLAQCDVLVGGTPCQAFSVAGLGNSLSDPRGNLTITFIRIYEAITQARHAAGRPAPVLLWENVPGIFSKGDNPFGCFLGGLAAGHGPVRPPGGRWGNSGYVRGRNHAMAWRVLDAQHFGVPQRRQRVFLVCCPRNGPHPEKILFEWEGVRRDTPPRREPGQSPAHDVAPCLVSSGRGTERNGDTRPYADQISQEQNLIPTGSGIPETARCVTTGEGKRQDWETCTIIPVAAANHAGHGPAGEADPADPIAIPANLSGTQCASTGDLSPALCAANPTAVAFSGRARGDDGRGYDRAPQVFGNVAGCLDTVKPHCVAYDLNQVTSPANRSNPQPGAPCHTIPASSTPPVLALSVALRGRAGGSALELGDDLAHTVRASQGGGDKPHVLAFRGCGQDGFTPRDLSPPVLASTGGGTMPSIAHTLRGEGFDASEDDTGWGIPPVPTGYAVRRLTPVECERLQGFPDNFTEIPWRGKPAGECPDGPRYKAIGNSMAVPCVAWIGKRLLAAMLTDRA